jgi:hypothetical protein
MTARRPLSRPFRALALQCRNRSSGATPWKAWRRLAGPKRSRASAANGLAMKGLRVWESAVKEPRVRHIEQGEERIMIDADIARRVLKRALSAADRQSAEMENLLGGGYLNDKGEAEYRIKSREIELLLEFCFDEYLRCRGDVYKAGVDVAGKALPKLVSSYGQDLAAARRRAKTP